MSTSATGPSTSVQTGPPSAIGYTMTTRLTFALLAVQFGLAGLGTFRGLGGPDAVGTWWRPHAVLGYGIGLLSLVLLLLAVTQRLGRSVVRWTAVIVALTLVGQPALAMLGNNASAWFGMAHALGGVGIAAVLWVVSTRVGQPGTG